MSEFVRLDEITQRLRRDCPWDREQTHASLARHAIEECYELVEAIDELTPGEDEHLIEELGDVMIQVFVHTAIAQQAGRFDAEQVAKRAADKLISRHPHVYGDVDVETSSDVMTNWEANKKLEKQRDSVLDGIPTALPALLTASKMLRKAKNVGIRIDVNTEMNIDEKVASRTIGDELFAVVQKAVDAGLEPEDELRETLKRYREVFIQKERSS